MEGERRVIRCGQVVAAHGSIQLGSLNVLEVLLESYYAGFML